MVSSRKKFVGILGGSFDPPHTGHLFISKSAMIKLGVDEIWWIVTYGNPLKKNTSNYKKRVLSTRKFLENKNIKVFEICKNEKNIYTIDLIKYLYKKFPSKKFIWLMGIDNLQNFHLWKNWKEIFLNIPIAIFDRPFYSLSTSKSKALTYFKDRRISNKLSKKLKNMIPPRWVFITGQTHLKSSTQLRLEKIGLKKKY